MACFTPLQGYESKFLTKLGKRKFVTCISRALQPFVEMVVPCCRCAGCRLEYARQWAIRCMHEIQINPTNNCFITLTYKTSSLPQHESLDYDHWVKFMKNLRKKFVPKCPFPKGHPDRKQWLRDNGIRFFMGPEYGDKSGRPHFHAILFNFDFKDKFFHKMSGEFALYRSPTLEKLWPHGYSSVGTATFESAGYCARYMLKKVKGDDIDNRYFFIDPFTGECFPKAAEKARMSRRPGIAADWFAKFHKDVTSGDFVVMPDGRKVRPPKYYDNLLQSFDEATYEKIKASRSLEAIKYAPNNTPARLGIRHRKKLLDIKQLVKPLEF